MNKHGEFAYLVDTLSTVTDDVINEASRADSAPASRQTHRSPPPAPARRGETTTAPARFSTQRRIPRHVGSREKAADVVATVGVSGGGHLVRCGSVEFMVGPGDLYALVDAARWNVKHEVLAADQRRLSITIRYSATA